VEGLYQQARPNMLYNGVDKLGSRTRTNPSTGINSTHLLFDNDKPWRDIQKFVNILLQF
jgi:hypothetical protein